MDRKIDFFIIGAPKCGTTSLYDYLGRHPEIFMPRLKENHFFANDEFYRQGSSYLDVFYDEAGDEPVWGGAHVNLLYFGHGAARLRDHNAAIKVVAVLRDPVARAYSSYWFNRRNGVERTPTFEEALALESERLRGGYMDQVRYGYLASGHYAEQLQHQAEVLGREQVHVILTGDLHSRTSEVVDETLDFLGLGHADGLVEATRSNVASEPRFLGLQRLLNEETRIKAVLRRLTTPRFRYQVRRRIYQPILAWNKKPSGYPEMRSETRERLSAYYAPHNQRLADWLGVDLSGWS